MGSTLIDLILKCANDQKRSPFQRESGVMRYCSLLNPLRGGVLCPYVSNSVFKVDGEDKDRRYYLCRKK